MLLCKHDWLFVCLWAKLHGNSGRTAKPFLGQWHNVIPTNECEQAVDIFLEMMDELWLFDNLMWVITEPISFTS